ncbi:hypothetical protein [Chryseobacterium mucoviscidosis]|uniref:Uncharacterized protein n=1 Tax=Chryseobacterium mucoviscidosis TaxID=1945581 RepID=A0A202C262_9FLAO|nr:hypothetical protein [Chryseobacterium mucoviscidosis]OVE57784.1 hypothetical protein B0E34_09405 [Chryseobacterium mucoviscidosis]
MIENYNVLEHVRKRPGMYIGSLDHSGFNELIHYLIQDFIETEFYEINFLLKENNRLIIEAVCRKTSTFISNAIKNINDYKNEHF